MHWKFHHQQSTITIEDMFLMSNSESARKASIKLASLKHKRRFSKRFSEHKDYPKSGRVDEPSGQHFTLPGHSVISK